MKTIPYIFWGFIWKCYVNLGKKAHFGKGSLRFSHMTDDDIFTSCCHEQFLNEQIHFLQIDEAGSSRRNKLKRAPAPQITDSRFIVFQYRKIALNPTVSLHF